MNWNKMKIIGSINKSFEALVNQIALSYLKREKNNFKRFIYVNGDGGDGGVESYAILTNGDEVGIQSKYFDGVIGDTQVKQIVKSIETALIQHPKLAEYHIFVSRDLGNRRKGTKNSEFDKIDAALQKFSNLTITLWGEGEILNELQKTDNIGIYDFWFEDTIFDLKVFDLCLEKQNSLWLNERYISDLFMAGNISDDVLRFCGINPSTDFLKNIDECEKCFYDLNRFFNSLKKQNDIIEKIDADYKPENIEIVLTNVKNIIIGYKDAICSNVVYDYNDDYYSTLSNVLYYYEENVRKLQYKSVIYNFSKELKRFLELYGLLLNDIDYAKTIFSHVLEISGDMGVGKTNVVGYVTNRIIQFGSYGIPINVSNYNMKNNIMQIVFEALGLKYPGEQKALNILNNVANIVSTNKNDNDENIPYIVVFFDGCDEAIDYKLVEEREKEALYISEKYNNIKFVFLGRPYCFNNIKNSALIKRNILSSGENNLYDLIQTYFKYYKIKYDGALWALDYIKSPLMLKLFCEVNSGETINSFNDENSSLNALFNKKMNNDNEKLTNELNIHMPSFLHICVKQLYELFNQKIHDRDEIVNNITLTAIEKKETYRILDFLSSYGYISKKRKIIDQNYGIFSYDYFPGNQSYFDYIDAKISYDKGILPLYPGSMNIYSIIVIEKEKILISHKFNNQKLFNYDIYSLINCSNGTSLLFYERIFKKLKDSPKFFRFYFNNILLNTMNDRKNPIGINLFNEFMKSFVKPIDRDLYWSIPNMNDSNLRDEASSYKNCGYINYVDSMLNKYDKVCLICVLFWQLSILDNRKILIYRKLLLNLAIDFSTEFLLALDYFNDIYDEQQFENILSVIYGALIENNDYLFAEGISKYLSKFYSYYSKMNNMSIRYFLFSISEVLNRQFSIEISFSKECILENYYGLYFDSFELDNPSDGTIFIDYDLSRYVLIDCITNRINLYRNKDKEAEFLKKYVKNKVKNYTIGNYIIAYARQLLLDYGWNDNIMLYKSGDNNQKGIDTIIRGIYYPATHGTKSEYMTVCEKYIWIARKQLLTIFAEFFNKDSDHFYSYDIYPCSLMEASHNNNIIEESQFDYKKFIPNITSKEEYEKFFKNIPDIDERQWLIRSDEIICNQYYSENVVENKLDIYITTNMFYSEYSLKELSDRLKDKKYLLFNPDDFLSYYDVYCYISPIQIITGNVKDKNEYDDVFSPACANVYYSNGMDEISETVPSCYIKNLLSINRYKNGNYYYNDKEVMKYYSMKDNPFVKQSVLSMNYDSFQNTIIGTKNVYWIIRNMIQTQNEYYEKDAFFKRFTKVYLVEYKNGQFKKVILTEENE